jgi:hypothetical protein
MNINNNTDDLSFPFFNNFNYDTYDNGVKNLIKCYNECILNEQIGGNTLSTASTVVTQIFSPRTKAAFTKVIRGILKTGTGISADIITIGAGGDIVVNAIFAVESSLSFLNNLHILISTIEETKELFQHFLKIDYSKIIPISSRLNLDDGLQLFEYRFGIILNEYINQYGSTKLDKINQSILNIIDKITTNISDWIACLFPDTAGLAGEITKTVLDYITQNGFTYTYNLISILPDNMQKMITNSFALKKLIKHSVTFLKNLIENMDLQQIAEIVQALGVKTSDLTGKNFLASAIGVRTFMTSKNKTKGLTSSASFLPEARNILVTVIDKYVIPNIGKGVALFNQLFPLFLMFTLFMEKYPQIVSGQHIPTQPIHTIQQITEETGANEADETSIIPVAPITSENEETLTNIPQTLQTTVPYQIQNYITSNTGTLKNKITGSKKTIHPIIIKTKKHQTQFKKGPLLSKSAITDLNEPSVTSKKIQTKRTTTVIPKETTSRQRKYERRARQQQSIKTIQQKTKKKLPDVNLSEYNIFNEPKSTIPIISSGPLTISNEKQALNDIAQKKLVVKRTTGTTTLETPSSINRRKLKRQQIGHHAIVTQESIPGSESLGKTSRSERRRQRKEVIQQQKKQPLYTSPRTNPHRSSIQTRKSISHTTYKRRNNRFLEIY